MNIKKSIANFQNLTNAADCKLVAVSKTKSTSDIMQAYEAGQRDFGENRVQELAQKYSQLPKDINWHMIGHLQSKKAKTIAPFVSLIHSVDSVKLAEEINKQAMNIKRIIPILLQVHIAQEETKYGFGIDELLDLIKNKNFDNLPSLRISGLMGMATLTDNKDQIRTEFKSLKDLHSRIKSLDCFGDNFTELSMGMTSDYQIALEEGSTMIRVGSAIFGER